MSKKTKKNKGNRNKGVIERIVGAGRFPSQANKAIARELRLYMLSGSQGAEFEGNLTKLLQYPIIKSHFLAFNKQITVSDIASKKVYPLNNVQLLSLYSCCFISQKEKLRNFSQKINKFECLYLNGEFEKATDYLEEIHKETGETLWYIRAKITLLREQEKKEELLSFWTSLKDRASQPIVEYIVDCLFWLSTSTQPQLTLDRFVLKVLKEYKDAGLDNYVGTLSLLFIPVGGNTDRDISGALENFQFFSIYDQYLMMLQWVEEVIAYDELDESSENKEVIYRWLKKLTNEINDSSINILIDRLEKPSDVYLSERVSELLTLYECGDYEVFINTFKRKLLEIKNPYSFINIVARSMAYIDHKVEIKSPIFKIIKQLTNIYSLKENSTQSYNELSATAIHLNYFRSSYSFLASIINAVPSKHDVSLILYINRLCYYTQQDITALTLKVASLSKEERGERVYFLSPISRIYDNEKIPIYRSTKHEFIEKLKNGFYDENDVSSLLITDPLKKDYYELKVNALIAHKQYINAIEFSAEILSEIPSAEICIPINSLVDIIEKEAAISIDAAIICYKYLESISQNKSYLLHEVVEEYLAKMGMKKPSEYLVNSHELSQKEIFFYEQVCIRDVIDYLGCFNSSNDLALERLKIISILESKDIVLQEKTKLETQEIINDIIIDSNVAKIGSSKVYVGVDGIKRDKTVEISALIDLYDISAPDHQKEKYIPFKNNNDDEIAHALVTSDKNSVLVKIMESLLISFIHDEEFGLDKNLSAEIRHGFFSNLMRSKLEDSGLILETNYQGEYIPPANWDEQLNFVKDKLKGAILGHLIWFTESFNSLLEQAEEWMKITMDLRDKSRLFIFIITSEDLENFANFIEINRDSSDVIDYIFNLFWKKTEECLENVRKHIDEELKDNIDNLFNELIAKVSQDKGGASLIEFMDTIERSKNGIREDIQTVSDWFHRSSGIVFEDVSLNSLIEIAVKTLRSYNARNFELNLYLDPSCTQKCIQGKNVKSIVIALVNFLDNAVKYSETQKSTNVIISVKSCATEAGYTILIQNKISKERLELINNNNYLNNQILKMKNQELNHLVRLEGGSGLKKAFHKLKSVNELFDVDLFVEDDIFSVMISYGN